MVSACLTGLHGIPLWTGTQSKGLIQWFKYPMDQKPRTLTPVYRCQIICSATSFLGWRSEDLIKTPLKTGRRTSPFRGTRLNTQSEVGKLGQYICTLISDRLSSETIHSLPNTNNP